MLCNMFYYLFNSCIFVLVLILNFKIMNLTIQNKANNTRLYFALVVYTKLNIYAISIFGISLTLTSTGGKKRLHLFDCKHGKTFYNSFK